MVFDERSKWFIRRRRKEFIGHEHGDAARFFDESEGFFDEQTADIGRLRAMAEIARWLCTFIMKSQYRLLFFWECVQAEPRRISDNEVEPALVGDFGIGEIEA